MNATSERLRISRRDIKRVQQEADACIHAMQFAAGARGESVGIAYMESHLPIETHLAFLAFAREASARAFRIATRACNEASAERDTLASLIAYKHRVEMIPSPVGTGYPDGSAEDKAYIKGFNYALRLARGAGAA